MPHEAAAVSNGTGHRPDEIDRAENREIAASPPAGSSVAIPKVSPKTKSKRPRPVFEAVFQGHGVNPESIPLGTLTEAFSAIKRLACAEQSEDDGSEGGEEPVSPDDTAPSIQLLDVKRGSAIYRFHCSHDSLALGNLRDTGKILAKPEDIGESDFVLAPIEKLSGIARRQGLTITLRQAGSDSPVLAKIEPDSYSRLSDSLYIVGETSLMASVQRVGGATGMRCALRIPYRQRMLYCSVSSQEVSRRLGECLYEDVAVRGEAKWLKHNWKIATFRIAEVTKFEKVKLRDALRSLREAGGHAWDKIADPKAYLEEVCGK